MAALTPQGYAAELVELCAASPIVLDHELDIRDTVVLRCRICRLGQFRLRDAASIAMGLLGAGRFPRAVGVWSGAGLRLPSAFHRTPRRPSA